MLHTRDCMMLHTRDCICGEQEIPYPNGLKTSYVSLRPCSVKEARTGLVSASSHPDLAHRRSPWNTGWINGWITKEMRKWIRSAILTGYLEFYLSYCDKGQIMKYVAASHLFFFFCLVTSYNMWNFSSLTRDRTGTPCIPALEAQSLNHWTSREVPLDLIAKS